MEITVFDLKGRKTIMAKKVAKTSAASANSASASPAPAPKKKTAEPRAKKHVKANAIAAAVEGFVTAVVNPADSEMRKAGRASSAKAVAISEPEAAIAATPHHLTADEELAAQPVIVDQSVAELSRPPAASEAEVETIPAPVAEAVTDKQIRILAYEYYLDRVGKGGSEAEDWLRAEQTLRSVKA